MGSNPSACNIFHPSNLCLCELGIFQLWKLYMVYLSGVNDVVLLVADVPGSNTF